MANGPSLWARAMTEGLAGMGYDLEPEFARDLDKAALDTFAGISADDVRHLADIVHRRFGVATDAKQLPGVRDRLKSRDLISGWATDGVPTVRQVTAFGWRLLGWRLGPGGVVEM